MRTDSFRPDIEGLRGLAILLVVGYHVHAPGFSGGFIGVDVFFVLSGYLITRLLVAEIERTGRLNFARFYARRVRRLLPAAALVLIITVLAGRLIEPPIAHREMASTALTTALYASNLRFARNATDYLAGDAASNPLLHTWSLSVEEQFYVLWPIIVLLVMRGFRGRLSRRRLAAVMAGLAGSSFIVGIWLTRIAQPWAFFGSPARAWEFALGGLAGLSTTSYLAGRPALNRWVAGVGLLAILLPAVLLDSTTSFPGVAAVIPVIGTAALLAAGAAGPAWVYRFLGTTPMQWIGRLSYSWYLWHWPVLVFSHFLYGPLSLRQSVLVCLLSFLLAAITHAAVENPIRVSPFLGQRAKLSFAMGFIVTLLSAGTSWWVRAMGIQLASASNQVRFQQAHEEVPRVYGDGCHLNLLDTETRDCVYGDPWSTTSIVLFGDSHAAQWFPALDRAGKRQGWKLVSWTKSSCPAAMVDMFNPQLGRIYEECSRWRKATIERIVALHPALVVLSNFGGYVGRGREAGEWHVTTEQWAAGVESTLRWITAKGTPALIVMDSPAPGFDVPSCLSQMAWHSWGAQRGCDFSVLENSRPIVRRVDVDVAARVPQVSTLDPKELICSGDHCPAERDGFVLYRDTHHLSVRFAASLSDVMERSITELLYRKAHPGSAVRLVQ